MRAGPNWAAHQTLTAEAATVLRHSLGLARRRRHAQVTPLHVAATLLTSKPSILLKSCLLSSRQPSLPNALHSRALELCFNVALNRLPTTPTIPLLNTQNASLSNALVAALKRAQAHQRRGCIEQQNQQTQQNNQQFMGVKVELEQLIISILDDPSVSRVMREAGFSSTAVKSQIEDYYSSTAAAATTTAATTSAPFQGGLGLGLRCSSIHEPRVVHCQMVEIAKPLSKVEVQDELHFCADCAYNYKREADLLKSRSQQKPFPSWLQTHASDTLNKDDDLDLRKKWSRLCQSLHRDKHTQSLVISNNISCTPYSYPWWPIHNSISFTNSPMNPNQSVSSVKFSNDHGGGEKYCLVEEPTPSLNFLNNSEEKDVKITLSLGNCNAPDSGDFDEKSLEKLLRRRDLLRMLQENVPWQSEKIAPIVEALVDPRKSNKRDTWLMIHGNDTIGKRRLACAIAESLLGSAESLVYLNMKEARDRAVNLSDELLQGKLSDRKKLVVLVENVDLASSRFMRQLADQFETEGEQDNAGEVVFVLTKGVCDCNEEGVVTTKNSIIQMTLKVNESVDHHKRKLDWGLSSKAKKRRIDDKDDPVLGTIENGDTNIIDGKDYLSIDLNVKADDEEDENWEKTEDSSPNSSELTGDEQMTPHSFLGSIDNKFTFDQSLTRETEMSEFFASKLTESFHKVCGGDHNRFSFSIEESVLEKISTGSGFVLNNLLEKWLKNIFQTSLNTIRSSGRVGESVRLCLGEPEEGNLDEGFLSSSLPKKIQICFGN